jgi:excisionase family DNA binding protein
MEEVFNVKELANYLHCSESTIRKLLRNNEIPSFRVACRIFFKKNLIDLWVDNQCIRSCEVMKSERE